MSSSQADAIAKLPGVGSVAPDVRLKEDQPLSLAPLPLTSRQAPTKGSHGPPQTTLQDPAVIRLQPGAAEELKVISQPPGSWRDELPGFGYASEAGKGGSRLDKVSDYPALFGKTTDIIVVGAVDNVGIRATNSLGTGKELTTSAPGRGKCASGDSSGSKQSSGTSFAAASVAGVIAVWLSQDEYRTRLQVSGKVATNVKAMVKSLSYPRIRRGPPVIWNGVDPRRFARPPKPQWSKKPQGFQRVYERDNVESGIYVATSNSASEGVTDNIEQWCLDKCIVKSLLMQE
ncbi:hypothetical protein CH063_13548 [Colletotrichum higginsianum]|uniref:Peptidase S8/S53 domain-containing protein n=1 Tax=Colletotrichum higginsianum (strain IMI 349063) TaxID=759273 RepID=H1VUU8_COLHI|nr:hypothetical protein CH063_13548 [Colletotrichum higginsianum]